MAKKAVSKVAESVNQLTVGYVRVSTAGQALNGKSLKGQEDSILAYAKAHGLRVDHVYADNGASGKDVQRPALARLRTDLPRVGAVIVYKFDRISRSVVDLYELLGEFETAGVDFRSVTEGVDTGSAIGKFIMSIMASLAQMERELISERTRHTLATKKARGEHVGRLPYGFRMGSNGRLERDLAQQKSIAAMKRARRRGKSVRAISSVFGVPRSTVFGILNSHQTRRNGQYLR